MNTQADKDVPTRVHQRLSAVAPVFSVEAGGGRRAGDLLAAIVPVCRASPRTAETWLLLVALTGVFPTEDEVRAAVRLLRRHAGAEGQRDLLAMAAAIASRGEVSHDLVVVRDATVADVNFSARHDIHTGIQRVVRETLPIWRDQHEFTPVAWTSRHTAMRLLRPSEDARVFRYSMGQSPKTVTQTGDSDPPTIVVPWDCVLLLPEVPEPAAGQVLATLAEHSPNRVVAVGYDMIPIVSADLRPPSDAARFTRYLGVIKQADRLAAISRSAEAEFRGFASALAAQGLPGPEVREVTLPSAMPSTAPVARAAGRERPVVLCVGTHDPHKNHRAVVHAAERLWREGVDFELVFIGQPGWRSGPDDMCVSGVIRAGRPARSLGRVPDAILARQLTSAAFTVFISLHEGFGLPVAESLAAGTPALVSNFGSLQEIAEGGGCLAVDPRDDDAILDAMRALLTDGSTLSRLRAEALERPERTWRDYADDLWRFAHDTVLPERASSIAHSRSAT